MILCNTQIGPYTLRHPIHRTHHTTPPPSPLSSPFFSSPFFSSLLFSSPLLFSFSLYHLFPSPSNPLYFFLSYSQESDALKAFRDAELTSLNRVEETNASLGGYNASHPMSSINRIYIVCIHISTLRYTELPRTNNSFSVRFDLN